MLDNLVGDELHGTAKRLKEKWNGKREFLIETSGGIVEDSLTQRLGPDIDVLSTSAVHQVSPTPEVAILPGDSGHMGTELAGCMPEGLHS